jgi:hypothetical protein
LCQGEADCGLATGSGEYYALDHRDFASRHIIDVVLKALQRHERRELRSRIRTGTLVSSGLSVMAGRDLELELCKQLAAGGNFTVRRLAGGKCEAVSLPALKEVRFSSGGLGSVFNASQSELYVPWNPNECAVDMVVGPKNMIIQVTLDKDHDLKLTAGGRPKNPTEEGAAAGEVKQGLKPIVEAMQLTGDINYYWAVPESSFEEWSFKNKYREAGRLVESWQNDLFIRRIVHWVLKVEIGLS